MPVKLTSELWFPDPRTALTGDLDGLLAVGGDLSVSRLLLAYRSGIFPWTVKPISWWSPDPRVIFELAEFHVPRSLARAMRHGAFEITVNRAFRRVMECCADPSRPGGWISPEFIEAYTRLHEQGHAHSVECWKAGELVGGIYGVAVGGFFAGESMFHRAADASKVALAHLARRLCDRGYSLFDTQMLTPITARFGAKEIPREEYLARLVEATRLPCSFV